MSTWAMVAREELAEVDVGRAESVERELDRLITKRHDPHDGDALLEPSYAESVRRYNGKVQAALREEWADYHRRQAQRMRTLLEALIAAHEAKAEKLLKGD